MNRHGLLVTVRLGLANKQLLAAEVARQSVGGQARADRTGTSKRPACLGFAATSSPYGRASGCGRAAVSAEQEEQGVGMMSYRVRPMMAGRRRRAPQAKGEREGRGCGEGGRDEDMWAVGFINKAIGLQAASFSIIRQGKYTIFLCL